MTAGVSAIAQFTVGMDETQARYGHRATLLLPSQDAHLIDDNGFPYSRGERGLGEAAGERLRES